MKRGSKWAATFLALVVCYVVVRTGDHFWGPKGTVTLSHTLSAKSKGDPKARLWIVEFFDPQCEACRQGSEMIEGYLQSHPGQIYWQLKFFPLAKHAHGMESAVYAECASRQQKFWKYQEILFKKQADWSILPDVSQLFQGYAHEAGLSVPQLEACVKEPTVNKLISDQRAEAITLGVDSTPTFFINGKRVVGNKLAKEMLDSYFNSGSAKGALEKH